MRNEQVKWQLHAESLPPMIGLALIYYIIKIDNIDYKDSVCEMCVCHDD